MKATSIPKRDVIPQASPLTQYLAHKEEIDAAIAGVLQSGKYIVGPELTAFEQEFAAYIGVGYAVGVASGTDALVLALRALNIGPGDEVITSPHTAVATVAAIELSGATPVLVDVEPETCLLDSKRLEAAITPRTKAVVPVHLFGNPADMSALRRIADRRCIRLIEDCAQAHGAKYRGKRVGTWGDMACFSFYPTKNLGAFGDAGMVVTANAELARRVRALREYGWERRYISEVGGANSRLDEIQAAILRVKLRYLDDDNHRRRAIAANYSLALAGQVGLLAEGPDSESVYHLYVVRSQRRDDLMGYLRQRGVGTAIHYPVPIHLQPAYRGRIGEEGDYPEAERAAREVLSLPIYPELRTEQLNIVIAHTREWAARS